MLSKIRGSPSCKFRIFPLHRTFKNMRRSLHGTTAFSLVEVTFALGVAAFCLLVLLGLLPTGVKTQQASAQQTIASQIMTVLLSDLRADIRPPPAQASTHGESVFALHRHRPQLN